MSDRQPVARDRILDEPGGDASDSNKASRGAWKAIRAILGGIGFAVTLVASVLTIEHSDEKIYVRPLDGAATLGRDGLLCAVLITIFFVYLSLSHFRDTDDAARRSAWVRHRLAIAVLLAADVAALTLAIPFLTFGPAGWFVCVWAAQFLAVAFVIWRHVFRVATARYTSAGAIFNRNAIRKMIRWTAVFLVPGLILLGWQPQRIAMRVESRGASSRKSIVTPPPATTTAPPPSSTLPAGVPPLSLATTTTAAENGENGPGIGAPTRAIQESMRLASEAGAAASWGCIHEVENLGDGSFRQTFDHGDAQLLGSEFGAGVLGGTSLAAVVTTLRGRVASRSTLGGQILNVIDCWGYTGDFEPIVDDSGNVVRLMGRAAKDVLGTDGNPHAGREVFIAPELLTVWKDELDKGRILAPVGSARRANGRVSQEFVDPTETGSSLTLHTAIDGGGSGSALRAGDIYIHCTGSGSTVPAYLVPQANN